MAIETGAFFRITATTQGQAQVDKLAESIKNVGAAGQVSAAQTAMAFRMLPAQFTDIATQLAGGQNPFMILLQQGGQIKDSFGGFGNMFRSLASALTPVRLAIGGVAAAVGILVKGFYDGQTEVNEFNKKLALTGNIAALNYDKFQQLAGTMSANNGTIGGNKELLMGAIGTGLFGQQSLEPVVMAMSRFKDISGQTADAVIKDFAQMANGVAAWAAAHNRAIGYLTLDQFKYIKQLEQQGRIEEAVALNSRLLGQELELRKPQLGWLERAWKSVGEAASWAGDKIANVGRPETLKDQIATLEKSLNAAEEMRAAASKRGANISADSPELQAARARLQTLKDNQREMERLTQKDADIQAERRRQVEEEASGLNDRKIVASSAKRLAEMQAATQERIRNLEFERQVIESYHQKNELSDGDYVRRITEIKQKQIAEEKRLAEERILSEKAQPTKDAAQEIDKARKIAEAQAEVRRLEQEGITARKKADLDVSVIDDRKSKALRYYIDDLAQQNDMLRLEAEKVDMTDFEYKQLVETKQREYDLRVKTRGMTSDEAEGYRKAAEAAGTLRTEIEKVNYEQSRTWQYGAKEALKKYADEASNTAKLVENAMTNAFKGMEDALVEFAMTGKFNFRDLATSIIKDLIRIQIQSSITGPLAAAMKGIGGSLFGGSGAVASPVAAGSVTATALPSLDGGGYTGSGSRSGGMDGKGGFLAMLHPQESVVDHYRGQGSGGVAVNVTVNAQTGQVEKDGAGNPGQLGAAIGAAIRQELINQKRPGGLLAA